MDINLNTRNGTPAHSGTKIFHFNDQTETVTGTVLQNFVFVTVSFSFLFFCFFFVGFVTRNLETHNISPCCRGGNLETHIKCFFISCDVNVINLAKRKNVKLIK